MSDAWTFIEARGRKENQALTDGLIHRKHLGMESQKIRGPEGAVEFMGSSKVREEGEGRKGHRSPAGPEGTAPQTSRAQRSCGEAALQGR